MSSLAAIMQKQAAEDSREAAVRVEMNRQRTQAQVLQESELDEDMKLALALSRADLQGPEQGISQSASDGTGLPAAVEASADVDEGACSQSRHAKTSVTPLETAVSWSAVT